MDFGLFQHVLPYYLRLLWGMVLLVLLWRRVMFVGQSHKYCAVSIVLTGIKLLWQIYHIAHACHPPLIKLHAHVSWGHGSGAATRLKVGIPTGQVNL